jgi:integrase
MRRLVDNHIRPQVTGLRCEQVTTEILQRAVEHARTHSTDDEARRTLKALRQLIREGHQAGWLVRHPEQLLARLTAPVAFRPTTQGETSLRISPTQVPTETAVAAAAWATQTVPRARWRDELMVQLAATAGPRLGELLDLDVSDVLPGRGIAIDSQVLEVGGVKTCSLPKGDKKRMTVHRAIGPGGYDVTHALEVAAAEALEREPFTCCTHHGPRHLLFPAPRGGWWSQSNFRERVWTPAREAAGWARGSGVLVDDDGEVVRDPFVWSWHSLRHHAATEWFKLDPTAVGDVSDALGHANTRITMEMYIGSTGEHLERLASLG